MMVMGTHSVDRPICRIYGYGSSVYAYTIRYSQLYVLIGSCLATYAYDFVAPRSYLISDTDTCMLYGRVTVRTPLASVDTIFAYDTIQLGGELVRTRATPIVEGSEINGRDTSTCRSSSTPSGARTRMGWECAARTVWSRYGGSM